jgi:pSer/pThr/pTyr-binding forkhead associated (FHA) protein
MAESASSSRKRAAVTIWILETERDAELPFTFRILSGKTKTIGRATNADFIVDAGMVSRVHCRLSATPDAVAVVDLDSTNGTYVNGSRVDSAQLKDGDELGIGRVMLKVCRVES